MSKAKIIDQNSENSVMKERLYLSNMRSPFIVNMICSFQDLNNLYLGLELMKGGDLRYHLINHSQTFTESQLKFLVSNLILGLEYIHSKNIIHRDIKPENILFDYKGYAYIADFNISCKKEEINNLYDISGTPVYMAPESVAQKFQDFTIDFYSLGIICYECVMGRRPYEGNNRHDVKKYLNDNTIEIEKDDRISDLCQAFINGLLKKNPADRLGSNSDTLELKENLFFKGFNWDILKRKKYISPISEIISFARSRNTLSEELFDAEFCNRVDEIDDYTKNRYAQIMAHENYPIYFRQYTFLSRDAVRDIAIRSRMIAAPPKKTLSYSRSSEYINLPKIKGTYSNPSSTHKSNGGNNNFKYNYESRKKHKNMSEMNSLKDYYEYKLNKYKQLLRQTDNNAPPQNNFNYYPNFFPNPMDMNPMNYQNKRNNMNGNDIYNDVCNGLQRKLYRDIFGGIEDDYDKNKRSGGIPNQYQINNYFPPPFMMPGMGMGMMNPYLYMMNPYGGKNDFFLPKLPTKEKNTPSNTHTHLHKSYKSRFSKKSKSGKKSKKSEKSSKKSKTKKSKKDESEEEGSSEEENEDEEEEGSDDKKKDDKKKEGSDDEKEEEEDKEGSDEEKEDKDGSDEKEDEDKEDDDKEEEEDEEEEKEE